MEEITIEDIREAVRIYEAVNAMSSVAFLEKYNDKGEICDDPKKIEEWHFSGLNNTDFIRHFC